MVSVVNLGAEEGDSEEAVSEEEDEGPEAADAEDQSAEASDEEEPDEEAADESEEEDDLEAEEDPALETEGPGELLQQAGQKQRSGIGGSSPFLYIRSHTSMDERTGDLHEHNIIACPPTEHRCSAPVLLSCFKLWCTPRRFV